MATLESVLSHIGHDMKVFFTGAVKVAQAAEPFVDIMLPGIAPLYNATVTAIAQAETASIAAGAQSGSGAQKLAFVISAIDADFQVYAKAQGITYNSTVVESYVNAAVATLNALPKATA